jgi:hypothetical protein
VKPHSLGTEDIWVISVIFYIYNVLSNFTIILTVSFDPRAQQAEINITQVRDPQSPIFLFLTNHFPIGKVYFPMTLKIIPEAVCHLSIDHGQGPFGKLKKGQ